MLKKTKTCNLSVTFNVTVTINDDVDIGNFLKNSTDFMGEPKNSDGVVIAMHPKSFCTVKRGKKGDVEEI